MPSVFFWPLTSRKLDFKEEDEHCPKSSFGVPPTFQQIHTSLLLPGAVGWHPGPLDPCSSFSSHFLSPFSLCDSISPPRFNIWGMMPTFGAFVSTSHRQGWVWDEEIRYRNFCSHSWNTWNFQHNCGQRGIVPHSQATTNHQIIFSTTNSVFELENSLKNGASAHFVCINDASSFCATVQAVLLHRRSSPGNVCWLLFKGMCRGK